MYCDHICDWLPLKVSDPTAMEHGPSNITALLQAFVPIQKDFGPGNEVKVVSICLGRKREPLSGPRSITSWGGYASTQPGQKKQEPKAIEYMERCFARWMEENDCFHRGRSLCKTPVPRYPSILNILDALEDPTRAVQPKMPLPFAAHSSKRAAYRVEML
jgi:hypothetical protein